MAKGDVIVQELAAAVFQPAAGVEVCIRHCSNTDADGTGEFRFYDGANMGVFCLTLTKSGTLAEEGNVCVFINNSVYVKQINAAGAVISGVQVK